MPKIVDHERYREELAKRAVTVFREHGYHGMSMRRMAQEIGVSKGVLYHYFSGKQALFEACSAHALTTPDIALSSDATRDEKIGALTQIGEQIERDFAGELTLLLDYLRNRTSTDIAGDAGLSQSVGYYLDVVSQVVGNEDAQKVLIHLFGLLLLRLFDGQSTPLSEIAAVL